MRRKQHSNMASKGGSVGSRGLGRNGTRASMACISCRQRKIKCDVQNKAPGAPCSKCQNAQLPCAIEPGGDRRRCRADNTSESLSSLRGRMQVLEDMLLKERGRRSSQSHNNYIHSSNTEHDQDTESQNPSGADVPSPAEERSSIDNSSATASSLSVDIATAMLDLQRNDTTAMPISDRRSNYKTQAPPFRYEHMPIDELVTLPTPPSPGTTNTNNDRNTTNAASNNNDNDNESNAHQINSSVNHNALSHPEAHVFDIGSYHVGDQHMSDAELPFVPPPNRDPTLHMDHMSSSIRLSSQNSQQPSTDTDSTADTDDRRFYGPTSQPYLHSVHEDFPLSVTDELEEEISLDIDSLQVRRLLFQNYWSMHALAARVIVDEKRFMEDRAVGKRSPYYSTFLENALLACATRTNTSSSMRELGQRFLDRAKAEVMFELEHLNVASMQGFLLLSDYEATRGRDRLGWMFCGMACRSLYDLGLHQNQRDSRPGSVDMAGRHLVFLTSFVYDQLWSLYLGRPSSISPRFVHAARRATRHVAASEEMDAWVSLCTQIAKVTEALNSSPWPDAMAYDGRLSELGTQLDHCFDKLPKRLRYEEGNAVDLEDCAYSLNIQYCGLRIVLHRNSIRLRQERRSEFETSEAGHRTEQEHARRQTFSAQIVHQNAVRVAKLIRTYKQIYGVEKIVTIMLDNMYVASTALISHIVSPANNAASSDRDIQWLRSLSETLEEVQKYYPIASVMITTLSRMVEGTTLAGIFRARRRRSSAASKESPSGSLSATMPVFPVAGWGSRDPFMTEFTFERGSLMDTAFGVDDSHTQYFPNPVIDGSPPWGMGFSR